MPSQLELLVENIKQNNALNNDFYQVWMNDTLSPEQLAIFARNYWEWTYRFPEALAGLIMISSDLETRLEYTKTLYSELGYGDIHRVHSKLFENFYIFLNAKMNNQSQDITDLKNTYPLLQTTTELINWERSTYSTDLTSASGAQLAIEWQAYTMLRKLYTGACNYEYLWEDKDEFHEVCEFFYVHIGSAEKDHKDESIQAAQKLLNQDAPYTVFKSGFDEHLQYIANFWNGIASAIL